MNDTAGYDAALPATLIVKGGFEPHSPSMKEMYVNEVRFGAAMLEHRTLELLR